MNPQQLLAAAQNVQQCHEQVNRSIAFHAYQPAAHHVQALLAEP